MVAIQFRYLAALESQDCENSTRNDVAPCQEGEAAPALLSQAPCRTSLQFREAPWLRSYADIRSHWVASRACGMHAGARTPMRRQKHVHAYQFLEEARRQVPGTRPRQFSEGTHACRISESEEGRHGANVSARDLTASGLEPSSYPP